MPAYSVVVSTHELKAGGVVGEGHHDVDVLIASSRVGLLVDESQPSAIRLHHLNAASDGVALNTEPNSLYTGLVAASKRTRNVVYGERGAKPFKNFTARIMSDASLAFHRSK
jgi:hypothetical protein